MSYKKIEYIFPSQVEIPEDGYMYLGNDSIGTWRKFQDGTFDYLVGGETSGGGEEYWLKDGIDNLYYTTAKVFLHTTDQYVAINLEEFTIINGAMTIGSNDQNLAGTLRYYGNNFWGYNGSEWVNMAIQNNTGSGSDYWDENSYGIYNTLGPVHVGWSGDASPHYNLTISGSSMINYTSGSAYLYFRDENKSVSSVPGKIYIKSNNTGVETVKFESGSGLGVDTLLKFGDDGSNNYAVPEDNDGNIDLGIDNTNEFEKIYTGELYLNSYGDLGFDGNILIESTTDTYPVIRTFRHPGTLGTNDQLGCIEWYGKVIQEPTQSNTFPSYEVAKIKITKQDDSEGYTKIDVIVNNDDIIRISENMDDDTVVTIKDHYVSASVDQIIGYNLFVDNNGGTLKSTYLHAETKYVCWDGSTYKHGITTPSAHIYYEHSGGLTGKYTLEVVGGIVVGVTDVPD